MEKLLSATEKKAGRNDPCPCGSGKKSKKCCMQEERLTEALLPRPDNVQQMLARLATLYSAGDFLGMQQTAEQLLERQSRSGIAWKAYSLALRRQGKEAWKALQEACRLLPADAEVWLNMGNALRDDERFAEAVRNYERALKLNPLFAEAHCNLGLTQRDLGRFADAIMHCRKAVKLKPDFSYAHLNLAISLRDVGQIDEAIASCRTALALQPAVAEVHNNLGNIWQDINRLQDAVVCYRRAIEINANFADAYVNLAKAQKKLGQMREAESVCAKALELSPNLVGAIIFQADILADQGQFDLAQAALDRAVSIQPDAIEAWSAMPYLRKMSCTDESWLEKAERLLRRELPVRQEVLLRFAMGKFFDDVGQYQQAFANYQRANELSKLYAVEYDRERQRRVFDLLSATCTRDWINRMHEAGSQSAQPVFIVGMPRSGTSLAEQILAAHPSVFGAGELGFWNQASSDLLASAGGDSVGREVMHRLADQYLTLLDGLSGSAPLVVDKMPGNFLFLGLIHAAFPNARIIHMQRDPVDTCLSIYFQRFELGHAYANDLENLAHYYKQYQWTIAHWRETLPHGAILDVPYESLVEDQEIWSRAMLDFIGLPWDERCLEFHRVVRSVRTASNWQVRQKINTSSVARWRNYQQFVEPLLDSLGPTAHPAGGSAEPGALGVLLTLEPRDVALHSVHHGLRQVDEQTSQPAY